MKNKIFWHADDYGVTLKQSERILECFKDGRLNSISVIPNSKNLYDCLKLLEDNDKEHNIRRICHLNFVEGRPVSDKEKVSLLVDEQGFFNCSFIKLFIWNYTIWGKKRRKLMEQLKYEINAQIDILIKQYDYKISGIDSHQHYHMIPIVMDALVQTIKENGYERVEYIRIPVDSWRPLIKARDGKRVPSVNYIKWFILNMNRKKIKKRVCELGAESPAFFGIFHTCEMNLDNVERLLKYYEEYADEKNSDLEIMFHPGSLDTTDDLMEPRDKQLVDFYFSVCREQEAECLKYGNDL